MKIVWLLTRLVLIIIVGAPTVTWACPDNYYESLCNPFTGCICVPNSGEVIRAVTAPVTEPAIVGAGSALGAWMVASRDSSLYAANPIPPEVRTALEGYVDDAILDRVRYQVRDFGFLNLGALSTSYGDALAITLDYIVIFRDEQAASSPALWAHELEHVKQFRDWGVNDFAISYVRNADGVEAPAYRKQNDYVTWAQANLRPLTVQLGEFASLGISSEIELEKGVGMSVINRCNRPLSFAMRWLDPSGSLILDRWNIDATDEPIRLLDRNGNPTKVILSRFKAGVSGAAWPLGRRHGDFENVSIEGEDYTLMRVTPEASSDGEAQIRLGCRDSRGD